MKQAAKNATPTAKKPAAVRKENVGVTAKGLRYSLVAPDDERLAGHYEEHRFYLCYEQSDGNELLIVVGAAAANNQLEELGEKLGIDAWKLIAYRKSRARNAALQSPLVKANGNKSVKWVHASRYDEAWLHGRRMAHWFLTHMKAFPNDHTFSLSDFTGKANKLGRIRLEELSGFMAVVGVVLREVFTSDVLDYVAKDAVYCERATDYVRRDRAERVKRMRRSRSTKVKAA